MKNIVFFLFLFTCKFCVGQVVRFQLYTTAPCSMIEHLDTAYSLYKITNTGITDYFAKKGIVNLTDTGKYGINLEDGPYIDTLIEISDTGLFVFKYKEPKIGLYNGGIDAPPVYKSCGQLINGYDDDFFPNGNIRIRGTFVNGRIKDSICTFYSNGKKQERITRLPKETIIEDYDNLNNLIWISHNSARSMYLTDYNTTEFFTNGKIKRKETKIRNWLITEEFYQNGKMKMCQGKRKRIEYYENGSKKVTYTWKHKNKGYDHAKDFTVYMDEYKENGEILQSVVYEDWSYSSRQPKFDISSSDWIDSLIRYRDGKVIFKVQYMDTKEYLKKYPANIL